MPTQGPTAPGTCASVAPGDVAWGNPDNAKVSDNARADASFMLMGGDSEYLRCTNFGFTSNGLLVGVTVDLEWLGSSTTYSVQLVLSGTRIGTAKTGSVPIIEEVTTLGSASDLWDVADSTDYTNSAFGVDIRVSGGMTTNGLVDYVTVTVTTAASSIYDGFFVQQSIPAAASQIVAQKRTFRVAVSGAGGSGTV